MTTLTTELSFWATILKIDHRYPPLRARKNEAGETIVERGPEEVWVTFDNQLSIKLPSPDYLARLGWAPHSLIQFTLSGPT